MLQYRYQILTMNSFYKSCIISEKDKEKRRKIQQSSQDVREVFHVKKPLT